MGLFRAAAIMASNVLEFPAAQRIQTGVRSPWTEGQLNQFVYSDVFGDAKLYPPMRSDAMSLPAVANPRALILSELGGRPLRAIRDGVAIDRQPPWLYRTNTGVPIWHRQAATFDDWIFYGDSCWATERGAANQITDAIRIPYDDWRINSAGQIEVRIEAGSETWRAARKGEVVYLPGPFEGLLNVAARTIRAGLNLEASWANRAATPLPSIILSQKEPGTLEDEEIARTVTGVAEARRNPNGSVMYVPYEYDVEVAGETDSQMFVEARNALKLDIAGFLGMDAAAVDAALPKASLNYQTQDGTQQRVENRLPFWTAPFESRLSMDDVCPRGQRIAFDFSNDPSEPGDDTGPFQED